MMVELQHLSRVVILVDMDCFYCQVEEKLNPFLAGKPIAVVQYNAWKGGGIIAVNYPARDKGVTRHMRGKEAKAKCPQIILVSVPTLREKADLTKYRDAGKRVAAVLQTYTDLLERASVDEAYLDITDAVEKRIADNRSITLDQLKNTHIVGYDIKDFVDNFKYEHHLESNFRLCMGGIIAEEIRAAVREQTGYNCSAGIAHNKTLAKLACGLHKPNQQTILPQDGIEGLFATLPLRKIRSLGGKFGYNLGEDLDIKTVLELRKFSIKDLISRYDEKTGSWLYKIARGIDLEPVTVRLVSKSIGCCKKFPGRTALVDPADVQHWVDQLSIEISDRLNKDFEENNRKAKHMVIGFVQQIGRKDVSTTRTHPLHSYEAPRIATDMLKVVNKHCLNTDGLYRIKYLGISAGKFEGCKKGYDISSYFRTSDKETNVECTKPDYSLSYFFSKMGKTIDIDKTVSKGCMNVNSAESYKSHTYIKPTMIDNNAIEGSNGQGIFLEDALLLNEASIPYESHANVRNTNINPTVTDNNSTYGTIKDNDIDSIFLEDTVPLNEADMSYESQANVKIAEINCTITDNNTINKTIKENNMDAIFSEDTVILQTGINSEKDYEETEEPDTNSITTENQDWETDSITDEIITKGEDVDQVAEGNTSSYFSNFFNNVEHRNRNFDTSKYLNLDPEISSTESNDSNSESANENLEPENCIPTNISDELENTKENLESGLTSASSSKAENYSILPNNRSNSLFDYYKPAEEEFYAKERCKECSKIILKSDMISHMDYHFALQMVRNEAHLYNTQSNIIPSTSSKKPIEVKRNKRKKCDTASAKLTTFFANRTQPSEDSPAEVCPHCNRKISTDEFLNHLDYHFAQNLHSEINPVVKKRDTSIHPEVVKHHKKATTSKNGKQVNQCKSKSVLSFFNQNM